MDKGNLTLDEVKALSERLRPPNGFHMNTIIKALHARKFPNAWQEMDGRRRWWIPANEAKSWIVGPHLGGRPKTKGQSQ